ncbi:hypothetical protein DL96DRAFT_1634702 [Flagelloscypha sp. PMI_526]|nr:hypothetical protein DL96DRAFT_1634702 [Flagelloscypha sp. PMI_526]
MFRESVFSFLLRLIQSLLQLEPVMTEPLKTVVILGASYGGIKSARDLAHKLPPGWRVLSIDRNEHMHHVYIFPRLSVLPGHEHKGYIPTTNIFQIPQSSTHRYLNATVTNLTTTHVTLSRPFPELGLESNTIAFDYCIYALGAKMPGVLNLWDCLPGGQPRRKSEVGYDGSKKEGMEWMKGTQAILDRPDVQKVLVVGGGALGVQFATDIRTVHPDIDVTLVHSREQLMPRFDEALHYEIIKVMEELGIIFIPSQRIDLTTVSSKIGRRIVKTIKGLEIETDFVMLCTGQTPNTSLLTSINPHLVNSNGRARVKRTMQLTTLPPAPFSDDVEETFVPIATDSCSVNSENRGVYDHMFVVGDAADAFCAIQAGHTAHYQTIVAAENILKLIERSETSSSTSERKAEPLTHYKPGLPSIKVTLGIKKAVYQSEGVVGTKNDGVEDLNAAIMWPTLGADPEGEGGMWQ